jgi:hypothetical protein
MFHYFHQLGNADLNQYYSEIGLISLLKHDHHLRWHGVLSHPLKLMAGTNNNRHPNSNSSRPTNESPMSLLEIWAMPVLFSVVCFAKIEGTMRV